jgi:glycyl-tRNA synthetase beta chain
MSETKTLLIEIGTEEMPARFVTGAAEQLKEKVTGWLEFQRIPFHNVTLFETPRRFAVMVEGVGIQQKDIDEELRGPGKKIAVDDQGNWTKAALGFARGKGVSPENLYMKEMGGVEYVFVRKHEKGRPTAELLPLLKETISSMSFPKNMRWGSYDLKYVRPIRWLVALFGNEVIPFEITGVQASNVTRGHRFLGQEVSIESPEEYAAKLAEQYVIVDPQERQEKILQQIHSLEAEKGWTIPIDEGLLDEVVHLVEYPTVLFGNFEQEYLEIPKEVLITSMREHQRYFPVVDKEGQLLPHFVTVRNGDEQGLDIVAKGNEKVLRARLSDARFFYEEDQKMEINAALSRLETVVFHEELGTIGDKIRRFEKIAAQIAEEIQLGQQEKNQLNRAAAICKFDLVSHMVYEFPELQGIMGERYATLAGEDEGVAKAIFEHYLPRYAGDQLPATKVGALLSIADKLDTIVGCFAIGIIPTGSQDPYALRRQATGIVQILLEQNIELSLPSLFELALNILEEKGLLKRNATEIKKDLQDFFTLRLKNLLQEKQVRYDVIDAVLTADSTKVMDVLQRAETLMQWVKRDEFKGVVESFNRVNNLAQKATTDLVDEQYIAHEAEEQLWKAFQSVKNETEALLAQKDYMKALETLATLQPVIDHFFEQVMVMVEDQNIRNNRLGILSSLAKGIFAFADFSKIVFA